MTALALLLVLAASPPPPGAQPTTPVEWLLGAKPAAGDFAAYESRAELVNFVPGADGNLKEAKLTQRARVTYLYLGPATVDGARGDWLELQEELVELQGEGLPASKGARGNGMVTRVLLARDGKVLRTVVQAGGRPARESRVVEGMSVAIGALAPFDALHGKLARGQAKLDVAGRRKVPAVTHEASTKHPRRSTKIWRRASDGLCLKIVDAAEGAGTTTVLLTGAGHGGATKIEGPIQQVGAAPERR